MVSLSVSSACTGTLCIAHSFRRYIWYMDVLQSCMPCPSPAQTRVILDKFEFPFKALLHRWQYRRSAPEPTSRIQLYQMQQKGKKLFPAVSSVCFTSRK
ncbi:hypothetical protein BDBG_16505 [Blastomyces gilchristii SLH14081]|uniref:Uncharacterized protein n=1 Tax=Blastomyces gilchristii (strain SLH14081) TaxID=559298 RepID=A0A179UD38_BLAGS|nr:uncharacterized protein BDBG_16505 [Blastomyces gilchristii SLH14081]OAT05884.1 hypothetical protein BDBG_16505 [Blastomyces gilchristii SLH14081]